MKKIEKNHKDIVKNNDNDIDTNGTDDNKQGEKHILDIVTSV